MFWSVFEEFTDEDRSAYLKFVWGRSRLPMDVSKMEQRHCIEYCKHHDKEALPQSHTCFFMMELPPYESEEVMRKKILTASYFCAEVQNW